MRTLFRASITGVKETLRVGAQRKGQFARGLARGVVKAAKHLLKVSRKIVPYDTWLLHDTSRVEESGSNLSKVAEVVYDQPYAARQHEDPTYRHKPGRTWKYLEGPARTERGVMREIVKKEALKR